MPELERGDVRYYQNELVMVAGPVVGNRVLVIYPERKRITQMVDGTLLKRHGFQPTTTSRRITVFQWDWLPVADLEEEPFIVRMNGTRGKRVFARG